ncbi:MAG: hypothetical protein L6Q63_17605, partial [Giesbergeria sp.]|nr:hypothetical protein [Giesbergeria sp.]
HSGLLKPASIANERNEIQIVDTHESSGTRINTGVSALQHQISRTLLTNTNSFGVSLTVPLLYF